MVLTEQQIELLSNNVYKDFSKPDDLKEFLEKNKIDGELVLKINFENDSLLKDENLNKLSMYSQKEKKYKLLILEASSTQDIDSEREYERIIEAIYDNENIQHDKYKDKEIVKTWKQVSRLILDNDYQICHIIGHGNKNEFILTEKEGIQTESLKKLVSLKNYLCVIFNICLSEQMAQQISEYVDYVVGMSQAINDSVAIEFSGSFYSGLNDGIAQNRDMFLTGFRSGLLAISPDKNSQYNIPTLYISYKRAILNLIKELDADNRIINFLKELRNHSGINTIYNQLYSIYSYPIKQIDLEQLTEIINRIDSSLVTSAFRETLPEKATVDNSELNNPKNIDDIIDILRKDYPEIGDNKVPSILVFAENLAVKFEENREKYQKIKNWIEKISSKLNIQILPKNGYSTQEIYTHLLITVHDQDNKFNLYAEYILEDERLNILRQYPLNLPYHNETTGILCDSFNEIPNKIKQYYDELFKQLREDELKKITIELFLPIQYLIKNLDKEWFIYDDTLGESPIVRELNIVVRQSERLKEKFYVPLKNNFKRFKQNLNDYSDLDIRNKEIEIIHEKVVEKNYQKISDNFQHKKIGVKLNYNGIPDKAFFKAIIRGATVIAFWRRCSIPEHRNFSDIDNYFKLEYFKDDFRSLIGKMHELCKEASYYDHDDNFYPLGFLCDNPNRIPNIKAFKSF